MRKERLEMISDGVIVIIMTIMVFEIKIPDLTSSHGFALFRPFLQHIGIFAMSFLILAVMWFNHHQIFVGVETVTPKIVWLNFLLLFCMTLIPLPTKALGQNITLPISHVFYGIVLCCNSIAFSLLQYQVNKTSDLDAKAKKSIHSKNAVTCALYGVSAIFAHIHILLSLFIFILIPAMYFIPSTKR